MKLKKVLALILSASLLAAAFAGCGGDGESQTSSAASASSGTGTSETGDGGGIPEEPEELTLPISEDGAELDVWINYIGTIVGDVNEVAGVQKMEEMTGVHINWTPVAQNELQEKFGILLSSGTYPDIVYPGSLSYPDGVDAGIADGVIYPDHDTLIRTYMPNYMAYLESSDEARKEATSDNGKMQVIKCIVGQDFTAESEGTYQGLAYRKDIFDGLGIEEPTTVEEWHDALVAAKESGIEHPFMIGTNGGSPMSLAWGVAAGMPANGIYVQMDGDTVVGIALQDGFGEYLETMKQWYSEGLIDPNFTTFDYYLDTPASVEANQHVLYSDLLSAFSGNSYYNMKMVTNESAYLQPVAAPAAEDGTTYQYGSRVVAGDMMFITTSCEDPVLAAKWLDFLYSKDGELLLWYGIEGESYELDEEGMPQYTDVVFDNPDNLPPADYLQKYSLNMGNAWMGKNNWSCNAKITSVTSGGQNLQMDAVEVWSAPEVNLSVPSRGWTLTEEEGDVVNTTGTAVTTMIDEYIINYITGADTTSFEDFKNNLVSFGYEDVIAAYQAAYDRYLAR